jgi:FKBP-type peptidyl-prolyl cis-trans isomerase FklB
MRLRLTLTSVLGTFFIVALAYGETTLNNKVDKESYALGVNVGRNLKQNSIGINADIFMKGIADGLSGGKRLLNDDEVRDTIAALKKELSEKNAAAKKILGEKNSQEGDLFLAENKKKEGVKTLPSGLQYKVINEGKGNSPKATDTVIVNYRGTLIDGSEFDNTYTRGKPTTIRVKGVIPGWTEALQLMKEGAKWQLFIPSNLAFGQKGAGSKVGPNATLLFEIELISIAQSSDKKQSGDKKQGSGKKK